MDVAENKKTAFRQGLRDGIPIALGYAFVSFGFGILAAESDLSVFAAVLLSLTNMTSAGQAAAVGIIATAGRYVQMALAQLVINVRYSLMGLSLSQKFDESVTLPHRFLVSFGITDEIFAVAASKSRTVGKFYMYGLILLPYLFWALGTAVGALAGNLLPETLKSALGILLYGMFVAIVVPPAKKSRGVLCALVIACSLSVAIYYLFPFIPNGFAVIISAPVAAALAALFFPTKKEGVK